MTEYFSDDKSHILQFCCNSQSEFKKLLYKLRKIGDSCNRYVTSIRYCDIIDQTTYGEDEVYNNYLRFI